MFSALLEAVKSTSHNDQIISKRQHPRRETDRCVALINGQIHPVKNWSIGGLLIDTDSRLFGIDNEIDIVLQFKLRERMMNITHRGKVVRKSKDTVAFEFLPISENIKKDFQTVIEDFVTGQFADSQS